MLFTRQNEQDGEQKGNGASTWHDHRPSHSLLNLSLEQGRWFVPGHSISRQLPHPCAMAVCRYTAIHPCCHVPTYNRAKWRFRRDRSSCQITCTWVVGMCKLHMQFLEMRFITEPMAFWGWWNYTHKEEIMLMVNFITVSSKSTKSLILRKFGSK